MKSTLTLTLLLGLSLLSIAVHVRADCEEEKNPDDGKLNAFFKNIGCKIQEGAEEVQKQAKPWAEKIGAGAKEFGSNVAQKYDEIKHKLTEDGSTTATPPSAVPNNAPTEKVPLAPISGGYPIDPAANGGSVPLAGVVPANAPSAAPPVGPSAVPAAAPTATVA